MVTFSRAQQALVEDLLEEARERHPEIEPFFDAERPEPVIVKNLENIQVTSGTWSSSRSATDPMLAVA